MELSPASLVFLQITSEMSGREGGEGVKGLQTGKERHLTS
jgi:hypothetical protein